MVTTRISNTARSTSSAGTLAGQAARVLIVALLCAWPGVLDAQTRRTQRRPVTPPPPAVRTEPAMMMCPQVLGEGVRTKRVYCDVLIGRDPAGGILITLPPHNGPISISFDLHNRHTYSAEQVKANKGYSRYTATVGVLTLDNTLVSRAIVQNEFRTEADLVDRISGGAGSTGVKAVAPTGTESVTIPLPEDATQ